MPEPRVSVAVRRLVADRAVHRCEYCLALEAFSPGGYCIEHVMPVAAGGDSDPANLAFACSGCNAYKSDKTTSLDPVTGRPFRLFHPRRDRWARHFAWSADTLRIDGITGIGRCSVAALKLNRSALVNLRRLLLREGLHPPAP